MTSRLDKGWKGILRWPLRRQSRKYASWSVIGLLFLNILSTAIFPGLSSGGVDAASPLTERDNVLVICTANGLKLVNLDVTGETEPVENTDGGYCAYCQPLNHSILCAPAAGTVTTALQYVHVQLFASSDLDRSVASFALKPLGSQAPPA